MSGGGRATILVVDDVPENVRLLEALLAPRGYDVVSATDGTAALELAESAQPDLVLLDVMMPELDGFEVCQRIRSNPAWSGTRIIMLTAKGREVERDKGLTLGADEYVTKPFSTRELVARVKQMLGPA